MRLLFREGPAKEGQAAGALAEHPQADKEGPIIERSDGRLVGLNTCPVDAVTLRRLHDWHCPTKASRPNTARAASCRPAVRRRVAPGAAGSRVKSLAGIERATRLKLDRLEAAESLQDLAALPGNRFEALKGDRKGQFSIRINDQFRICFEWRAGSPGPENVEMVDYH